MQPFYTSAESITIFNKLGTTPQFAFGAPSEIKPPITLSAYAAAARVLKDQTNFPVADSGLLPTYMPADPVAQEKQWNTIWTSLVPEGGMQQFTDFAELITLTLLDKKRNPVKGTKSYQVDIVKE